MATDQDLIAAENEIARLNSIVGQQQMASSFEQSSPQINDPGMIREQIGLEEVYDLIDNLLEGNVLIKDAATGMRSWKAPKDENMKLFSDEGINFIRKRMSWHINKNTLLSNYTEEQIDIIVKEFSISLQDAIFMKSRQFFRQPSDEKCFEVLQERIEKRAKVKQFARELLGAKVPLEQIKKEILTEYEDRIEYEIESIRTQLIKSREKEFESIILDLEFLVWSTYNRALKGEERGSIRRHQQSLEVKGGGLVGSDSQAAAKPGLISSMLKR